MAARSTLRISEPYSTTPKAAVRLLSAERFSFNCPVRLYRRITTQKLGAGIEWVQRAQGGVSSSKLSGIKSESRSTA